MIISGLVDCIPVIRTIQQFLRTSATAVANCKTLLKNYLLGWSLLSVNTYVEKCSVEKSKN